MPVKPVQESLEEEECHLRRNISSLCELSGFSKRWLEMNFALSYFEVFESGRDFDEDSVESQLGATSKSDKMFVLTIMIMIMITIMITIIITAPLPTSIDPGDAPASYNASQSGYDEGKAKRRLRGWLGYAFARHVFAFFTYQLPVSHITRDEVFRHHL